MRYRSWTIEPRHFIVRQLGDVRARNTQFGCATVLRSGCEPIFNPMQCGKSETEMLLFPVRLSRRTFGALLLAAVALLSSARQFKDSVSAYRNRPAVDGITEIERHFQPLRQAIPPQATVGYISDLDVRPESLRTNSPLSSSVLAIKERVLIQSVLYPTLIDSTLQHEYIIANWHGSHIDLQDKEFRSLAIVKDFGNGLLLLRRTTW